MSETLPTPAPRGAAPEPSIAHASSQLAAASSRLADGRPRTYVVRTLGCQMNVHDSEHM
ncbi:MAG TPA: tRNA (N6-isopentenyl adenosine(37)-C2)-methylthiotransferase MiaB, partial [Actinotalea sp.]|nr:tRNA (N6-isopentenyl adenosine(37)-C2)-methylthiotransferase MiaB [Actinotalea sp.]